MKDHTIHTTHGPRHVTRRQAILHLARCPGDKLDGPRGTVVPLRKLAGTVTRFNREHPDASPTPIGSRLLEHLAKIGRREIRDRGLDTPAGWGTSYAPAVISRRPGLWLVHGEGWHKYSSRAGSWYTKGTFLCGRDEGALFAVRVPSSCATVPEALDFLTPAPIRDARRRGLPTVRQGDIFFRPVRGLAEHDFRAILWTTRHNPEPQPDGSVQITHPEHATVTLPAGLTWRAYRSTQMASRGRRFAD